MSNEERITGFIQRLSLNEGGAAIAAETSLLDSGLIDSTGIIEVVAFLESEFGIRVEDEEIVPENFETVRRIAALVESKRAS